MSAPATYTAEYSRESDGSAWTVRVLEIADCRTQGRSIHEARDRIRRVLSQFVDGEIARNATLTEVLGTLNLKTV